MAFLFKEWIRDIKLEYDDIKYYLSLINDVGSYDIHYGLWEKKSKGKITNKGFINAQKRLSDLAVLFIQKNSKNIIDVGGGIGGFSNNIKQLGYFTVCIVPDKKLINIGRKIFPSIKFIHGSAEFFKLQYKFDTAILFESLQYFTDKRLGLYNISKYIKNGGRIIILDEFSESDLGDVMNNKILINFLCRNGFNLLENINLTDEVLPTCDFIINYSLNRSETMTNLWDNKRKDYLNKTLTYRLLVFNKVY